MGGKEDFSKEVITELKSKGQVEIAEVRRVEIGKRFSSLRKQLL